MHASRKAARETGADVFATEGQLADLIGADTKRLVRIWNGLPGVKPVTKFAAQKVATQRIWKTIQRLGELAGASALEPRVGADGPDTPPSEAPAKPATAAAVPTAGAQAPEAAPTAALSPDKAARSKESPPSEPKPKGIREGSKTAQVVALLQRKNGATLAEIVEKMSWHNAPYADIGIRNTR
jgi:hypothetical protein